MHRGKLKRPQCEKREIRKEPPNPWDESRRAAEKRQGSSARKRKGAWVV